MIEQLGSVKLTDETPMDVLLVRGPLEGAEADVGPALVQFLRHKGEPWNWQNELGVAGRCGNLVCDYYVGRVGSDLVGNVSIFHHNGLGILAHVFTAPEHRRKGVARAILQQALRRFQDGKGKALILGTDYNCPAYRLYREFGFESIADKSGYMDWFPDRNLMKTYFADEETTVKPWRWEHWPSMCLLTAWPSGDFVRSIIMNAYGQTSVEWGFLAQYRKMMNKDVPSGKVLVKNDGRVMGFALRGVESRWPSSSQIFDVYIHPIFEYKMEEVVRSAAAFEPGLRSWVDSNSKTRIAGLLDMGYLVECRLFNAVHTYRGDTDMVILHIPG